MSGTASNSRYGISDILREEVFMDDKTHINVECLICKNVLTLYFNGGELDRQDCCGRVYELQHARIDYVIRRQ